MGGQLRQDVAGCVALEAFPFRAVREKGLLSPSHAAHNTLPAAAELPGPVPAVAPPALQ